MSEYIDKQAFNDELAKLIPWAIESPMDNAYMEGLNTAHNVLLDFPAADVAPVVRARWIERGGYCGVVIACSACGNGIFRGYSVFRPDGTFYTDESANPPYCPHCGAKMDVELP